MKSVPQAHNAKQNTSGILRIAPKLLEYSLFCGRAARTMHSRLAASGMPTMAARAIRVYPEVCSTGLARAPKTDLTPESRSAQRFSSSRALPADEDVIVYREPSGFVITPRSEVRDHPGRNALFRALLPHDH